MAEKPPVRAAGVVLLREHKGERQTMMIHRPRHDDWSLPKGKAYRDEPAVVCAARECVEETGFSPVLGPPLARQEYLVAGRPKTVDYWVARVGEDLGFTPNNEVDATRWVSQSEAAALLTYPRDVETMNAGFAMPESSALVVVRHASAMKRSAFHGKDHARPLTARGQEQAARLAPILAAYRIERVHSSPSKRCLRTVRPYAKRAALKVRLEPALSESGFESDPPASRQRAETLLHRRRSIVICSHRPVLPTILSVLADISGFDADLIRKPLRPTDLIVIHRTRRKGKLRIIATERHSANIL